MAAVQVGTLSKLCLYFGELFKLDVLNITYLPLDSYNSVRHAVLNSCITCLDAFLSTLFLLVLHVDISANLILNSMTPRYTYYLWGLRFQV